MFNKILIANRGEIACRVIRTAKDMGIKTVAIYSDADVNALHVEMADEAWRIGPPEVAQSYLQAEKIIEVAKASGAEAIHPGYGFLSENPDFVQMVEAAGIRFIGPSADAIKAMGLKDAAKALMEEAGVPVVPGYHGENQDAEFLAKEADKIGYPVLIKARAGGGGKGMRKVDDPKDFADALAGAQREGLSAFGDASCLIEKWISEPRHIEIQVFGDDHGNAVHLFERDCSLQRRHQKVIEEAPAPGMTQEMRAAMGAAAVRCAKAIGYSGAGTVEFIVDGSNGLHPDKFWFMEMNTRLQVEHPVTEYITGVDLVGWQLRVAAGENLPATQEDLTLTGHAFEARIYAEDVPAGFLPATGKLETLRLSPNARIDSGVREGDEISPWYDPMISKLIVHAETREMALHALHAAIEESMIAGTVTNMSFLAALCRHEGFSKGDVDTGLIERDIDGLVEAKETKPEFEAIAAIVLGGNLDLDAYSGWHMWKPLRRAIVVSDGSDKKTYEIAQSAPNTFRVYDNDASDLCINLQVKGENKLRVELQDQSYDVAYSLVGDSVTLFDSGNAYIYEKISAFSGEDDASDGNAILSPMPGLVKVVSASVGDKVEKGQALLVLEAMKMEHTLTAERDGVVDMVAVSEGQQVEAGVVMLTLEAEDD